jgi:hypothetical protein
MFIWGAFSFAQGEHGQPERLIVKSPNGCPVRKAFLRTLRDGSSRIGEEQGGYNVVPEKKSLF